MEEQKLADILFGADPLKDPRLQSDSCFAATNHKQFGLFYARQLKRVEERLSQQFGACMALFDEGLGLSPAQVAKAFTCSAEYRQVREDITDLDMTSSARFEIGFLNFVLRTQEDQADFLTEFSDLYLRELAMDLG